MSWRELAELLTWRDAVDVAVVTVLIYNLLLFIRGTRAVQMTLGIVGVALTFVIARRANLVTLEALLEKFLIFLPFALIVLFQQEIRRALASFGRSPLFGRGNRHRSPAVLDEIVLAATAMAERRIGALLVVERIEGLRAFAENGIRLDALVSFDLLINLFIPDTPLHDGAAIIQGERLVAARCVLPLSSSAELSRDYGTRHRAALGISEETDAVAIVVSEESGAISVAFGGKLIRNLDAHTLRGTLQRLLVSDLAPAERRRTP